MLRTLRAAADAILVGSVTLAAERYANLLDPGQREARALAGRSAHPLVATISRRLDLDQGAIPVLGEPGVDAVIFTEAASADPRGERGGVALHPMQPGTLTATRVLDELAAGHAVQSVVCEGGPALLARLVAENCLDDLLLTVSPLLAGGEPGTPAVLGSIGHAGPVRLALRSVHRAGDHLFLHYARDGASSSGRDR